MKPWKTLATAEASGASLVLQERDGEYVIRAGGHTLMSSARHGSEEALAQAGLAKLAAPRPRVLLGGLGLGYTLRAALDLLGPEAEVVVCEISGAVVAWNRGPLAHLAGAPLQDPRVAVEVRDVGRVAAQAAGGGAGRYDAILLDVDNGPQALSRTGNEALYGPAGLETFRAALRPGGALVVWSAGPDPRFAQGLRRAGFLIEEAKVPARARGGARHTLFVGRVKKK